MKIVTRSTDEIQIPLRLNIGNVVEIKQIPPVTQVSGNDTEHRCLYRQTSGSE